VGDALAGDVEAFRIGENGLILVGVLHGEQHGVPRADGDAIDVDVDSGVPGQAAPPSGSLAFDGAGETEDLFHRGGSQRRVPLQRLPLLVVGQQEQHAPFDDRDHRCVSGEDEPGGQVRDPIIGQRGVALSGL
jgi:hypothetical protein